VGFCYLVDPSAAETTLAILRKHGRSARRIGRVVADPEKTVRIPPKNLAGHGKKFWRER
jgi:hydrogenase maturation factor